MFDYRKDTDQRLIFKREAVFIVLSGVFPGTLAMLNILGISRYIEFSIVFFKWEIQVMLFIGVLPYPITFLCTDFISELYGKSRARFVVWTGLILNIWVVFILWLGNNVSTLVSQLVDTVSEYTYKVISALIDTVPFYFGVRFFSGYLQINPNEGYEKTPNT